MTEDMYKEGFIESTNIDISPTVIQQMQDKYKDTCPNAKCKYVSYHSHGNGYKEA